MKIAFLCPSLEPGKDGVGDYSRRLAGELIRNGHTCVAAAINDPHVSTTVRDDQEIEGTPVPVMRLPDITTNGNHAALRGWLGEVNPDWLSLQFVPFGFDRRGLCFALGNELATVQAKGSWHVMFHELWLGLGQSSTIKERLWGNLQRLAVLKVMRRIGPRLAHTQTEPYRAALGGEKIEAGILPLFSNIPYVAGNGWSELLEPLVSSVTGLPADRKQLYLAGVLGAVHSQWNAQAAVAAVLPLAQRSHQRLVLVFLGKNNLSKDAFAAIRANLQGRADVVVAGERPATEISKLLQALDLGLATTPLEVIQKSGSCAAMLEHGLPVLVIRNDWHLRGPSPQRQPANERLFTPQQFAALKALPERQLPGPAGHGVQAVAREMLASLQSVAATNQ